jgi:hypothetical protein
MKNTSAIFGCILFSAAMVACESPLELNNDEKSKNMVEKTIGTNGEKATPANVKLKNYSVTPPLVKKLSGFEHLEVFSLISSDDTLENAPAYRFGGSADGAGLLKTQTGFSIIVNHEDNFAVSRITLNNSFKPKKGEYILNSDGGQWRLCSGTMVTPDEHGFGPLFLTCGESGEESRTHSLSPDADPSRASVSRELPGLGRWSAENAVPLPKTAFAGKTVILIGDDDSDVHGGQLAMYIAGQVGDLENGKLFVMRRTDLNTRERDIVEGSQVNVEFVEVPDHKNLTGAQINATATLLKSIPFGRVEDIDYRKGVNGGREVYFNVTGQNNTGVNADYSRTKYGRVYKLLLNENNPLAGKLEVVLDGDKRDGKAGAFQNPDNILLTENFAYIQEDPNAGYNDQTHDAYIYQYDLATKTLKVVFELDHHRTSPDAAKYNSVPGTGYPAPVAGKSGYGSWEYGSFTDISGVTGISNTFMLCVQSHSWRSDLFKGVDGGSIRPNENQGSQIVIVKGLPK